jgi:nitrogen fixation/metabolism regulation signal transduction histidine kinase
MDFSRFHVGIALRIAGLSCTLLLFAWLILHTQWYATWTLCAAAAIAQMLALMRFATQSSREVARFLDAVSFDDTTQSFLGVTADRGHGKLGASMTRVIERLRAGRSEREEQARYLQALLAHVPVALISIDEHHGVQLLNMAGRRLFETALTRANQMNRHGESFAAGMEALRPGHTAILNMERSAGTLQLKAAATDLALGGVRRRLVSLQNIESEMSAQEMAAWQTVIRVLAHEIMNSLTPVSSLTATAHKHVRNVLEQMASDDPRAAALTDARDALETVARRSEGLLHFVQNHRRLTKRLVTQIEVTSVQRVFARLQRLLANDLTTRDIHLTTFVEPETLEVTADIDLLDQALINLVQNAIDALRDSAAGRIALSARRDPDGRIVLSVTDNGPGVPEDQRDKVFVPFFTTKRQGSGIGLTLVRQIATVHNATVDISQTIGGGATVSLRF